MDKKMFNKSANFFKKEGFYVILFVCLCIVATVAAVTSRNTKQAKKAPIVQSAVQKEESIPKIAEESSPDYQNAMQVKKPTDTGITVTKDGAKSTTVTKTVDTKFLKPVEGTLARAYSEDPVFWDSNNKWRSNFGIDIKAELGKPVVAVLDGKVEDVTTTDDGMQVTINHQNGTKTVYANLDSKVTVTKGQDIKKGAEIGKVGNTTLRAGYEKYGSHLHFAVLKGKDFIDPAKYIKY